MHKTGVDNLLPLDSQTSSTRLVQNPDAPPPDQSEADLWHRANHVTCFSKTSHLEYYRMNLFLSSTDLMLENDQNSL